MKYYVQSFDDIVQPEDPDFSASGLKEASLIRVGRLAVVDGDILLGAIGEVEPDRLQRVKTNLAAWSGQA
jgi:mRNA interferase MazF